MEPFAGEQNYEELTLRLYRAANSSGSTYDLRVQYLTEDVNLKFAYPLREHEIERAFTVMQRSSPKFTRGIDSSSADVTRRLGESLIAALNSKEFWNICQKAAMLTRDHGTKLRVRLRLDDFYGAILPWEFMFGMFSPDYTSLSLKTPVVRHWGDHFAPECERPEPPLRVLAAVADKFPFDTGAEGEIEQLRVIENRTQKIKLIDVLDDCTPQQLTKRIRNSDCHVLHLIASGSDGVGWSSKMNLIDEQTWSRQSLKLVAESIAHEGEYEKTDVTAVPARQLLSIVTGIPSLRLVCLSGDCTDHIATQLAAGLPAVVGWRGTNTEIAYLSFTRGLYAGLAGGHPLEEAVTLGRQAVETDFSGSKEWGMPVCYMQTKDSALWLRGADDAAPDINDDSVKEVVTAPADLQNRREWEKLNVLLKVAQQNLKALSGEAITYSGDVDWDQAEKIKEKIANIEDDLRRLT